MNCSEVRESLSAYFDGELPEDRRVRLSEHVGQCSACAKELAVFEKLSGMTGALANPEPPSHIWTQLESELVQQSSDQRSPLSPMGQYRQQSLPITKLLSLAATLLVAVGIGWFAYQSWFGHGDHDDFTAEFGHYLDEFQHDPDLAQQFLLASYEHQRVDPDTAIQQVGYRPAVADGLPEGYSIKSSHVMNMPCCTCVQSLCERSDGSTFAIFEHDDEETKEWFGDRPESSTECNGQRCSLVELNNNLAASWKNDRRHITVVGVRDVAELNQLVAWFDKRRQVSL